MILAEPLSRLQRDFTTLCTNLCKDCEENKKKVPAGFSEDSFQPGKNFRSGLADKMQSAVKPVYIIPILLIAGCAKHNPSNQPYVDTTPQADIESLIDAEANRLYDMKRGRKPKTDAEDKADWDMALQTATVTVKAKFKKP